MGWKTLKDHYRINSNIVHVTEEGIAIGSSSHIVIGFDGQIKKRFDGDYLLEFERCQKEIDANTGILRELIDTPDTFSQSIRVFTYHNGDILEAFCEEPGWPNVTHDGQIMYNNLFSTDRNEVISWALENAKARAEHCKDRIKRSEAELSDATSLLGQLLSHIGNLLSAPSHPGASIDGVSSLKAS